MSSAAPYGPSTAIVRRFLASFAGLSAADRIAVIASYTERAESATWQRADAALATALTGADREAARDAVAGPLLQLVRIGEPNDDDPLASLDPVAEPALAALLALLVADVLDAMHINTLYAPFEPLIPRASLQS